MKSYHHGNLKDTVVLLARKALEETKEVRDFSGLSLRELARQAGVSPTAVYHHFPSKEALLEAIALHAFAELHQAWEPLDPPAMGPAYLEFFQGNPALLDLLFGPSLGDSQAVLEAQLKTWTMLERGMQALLRSTEVETEGLLLWALVHGLAQLFRSKALGLDEASCPGMPKLWYASGSEILGAMAPLLDRAFAVRRA